MPDVTDLDTIDLLNETDQYPLSAPMATIITELKRRVIKQNDPEDNPQVRGGVRPKKHSIVP